MDNSVPVLIQTNLIPDGTTLNLNWNDLTQSEQEIVAGVVFAGSPEEARKKLVMTHSTFYRKWGKLKPFYNEFIKNFPKRAGEVLISQSIKAAQELGKELDSNNEKIRHAAATEILDRTLSKEPVEIGLKRRITLEEFLGSIPNPKSSESNMEVIQPPVEQIEPNIHENYSSDEEMIL